MTSAPYPQNPEATSVISWGESADYVPETGKHHVSTDTVGRRPAPRPTPDDTLSDVHHPMTMNEPAFGTAGYDTVGEVLPAITGEAVNCPECGTIAHVTLNRRESIDFCHTCDYPLFWAPTKILRGPGDRSDESLRRLPGTSGRVSVASMPCPFCAEQNAINALVCVRCGRDMHPAAPPPPPAPIVYAPPPLPEPVWEPEPGTPWWVWLLLALGVVAIGVVVVLMATGVFN